MSDSKLVTLRSFPNDMQARLAQARLEANGIPSMLQTQDAGGMYPQLQFVLGARLIVRAEDADAATELLDSEPPDDAELDTDDADAAFGDGDDEGDDERDDADDADDVLG